MKIVRNILAVILGLFIGGTVNMGLIMISDSVVPLPEGVDPSNMESLLENMHRFKPINFLMPFLAHALGTLVGAIIAGLVAYNRKMTFALVIGAFFLLGGVINAFTLPAPVWFIAVDVLIAYLPMAFVGGKLALMVTEEPVQ